MGFRLGLDIAFLPANCLKQQGLVGPSVKRSIAFGCLYRKVISDCRRDDDLGQLLSQGDRTAAFDCCALIGSFHYCIGRQSLLFSPASQEDRGGRTL